MSWLKSSTVEQHHFQAGWIFGLRKVARLMMKSNSKTGCYPVAILDQFSVEGHLEKPQYFKGFVVRAEGFEPPTF